MIKFTKALKKRANQLIGDLNSNNWDSSIPGVIRREIALTVDQINRLKELHEKQLEMLHRVECYVGSEIMQMEQRTPRYSPYRFPERDKLQQRLFNIEKERRNLTLHLQDKKQSLEDRLLSLINKHEQIDI